MVIGDIKRIDLSSSLFERIIERDVLYVDKTKLVEQFLNSTSMIQLVVRQRRLGKSLNMDMLRCFLTDRQDLRHLFKGLYIESSPVWEKAHSAPVFYFDFKNLTPEAYKKQISSRLVDHVCSLIDPENLDFASKREFFKIIDDQDRAKECLFFLTELAFKITGKRSYLLIDEYDSLLMRKFNTEQYEEIRDFEAALLSLALKGNPYLEKAMLTGVMRVSHESMFSGLNNIVTRDVFKDEVYTDSYGLTESEMRELNELTEFDIDEARRWYNGIMIDGKPIYNIYSVMSFLSYKEYDFYWGKSGTLDLIVGLLNDERRLTLIKMLNGEHVDIEVDNRISLEQLDSAVGDEAFYSLLVQAGYLAMVNRRTTGLATVYIPNQELMIVWKNFVLARFYANPQQVRTLFDNVDSPVMFEQDVEYFLSERLSYHDLAVYRGENVERAQERAYHIFLLGLLSAYDDMRFSYPLSNRESGDGRYDVLVEREDAYYIFEFKTCTKDEDLGKQAEKALMQIEVKRYGAELGRDGKRVVELGVAIRGKECRVAVVKPDARKITD